MGIGSYKEAERYRMRTNKNLTRTFYLDTKRTLDDEPFAWEQPQVASIEQPEAMQEFADGGRVGFELGGRTYKINKPLTTEQQNRIKKNYPNADFSKFKYGFSEKDTNNYKNVYSFVKRGKTQIENRLEKLKELVLESNLKPFESLNERQVAIKAGYVSAANLKNRSDVRNILNQLIPLEEKFSNYLNNVINNLDNIPYEDIVKAGGMNKYVSKPFGVNKIALNRKISNAYSKPEFKEARDIIKLLSNPQVFDTYGKREMFAGEVLDNLDATKSARRLKGGSIGNEIINTAERSMKAGNKNINFLTKPGTVDASDIVFEWNGKLYGKDVDEYKGRKVNNLTTDLYKLPEFNEYLDVKTKINELRKKQVIDPQTKKPTTYDQLLRKTYAKGFGKNTSYERSGVELDHLNIKDEPFSNLRPLPAHINQTAGLIKKSMSIIEDKDKALKAVGYFMPEDALENSILKFSDRVLNKNIPVSKTYDVGLRSITGGSKEYLSPESKITTEGLREGKTGTESLLKGQTQVMTSSGLRPVTEKETKIPKEFSEQKKNTVEYLTNYLNNNPDDVKALKAAGIPCRRSTGGKVDVECLAENIIKEVKKLETGTDLQKKSALTKFKNATKLGAGLAEEVIGFGKGVVGRTLGPLAALNSALEQWTSGNYREGIRKIADLADITTLVGDPLGFEKSRQEARIEEVRNKIGKENQSSLDRILEFKDKYYQLQDINTKLERAEYATQDPNAAPESYDPDYINELKKQQVDLNKIINSSKYKNFRTDASNVAKAIKDEIFKRNIKAPDTEKYVFETAAQEQFKSIIGEDIYNEIPDVTEPIYKNLTASEKIQQEAIPFEAPEIQSPDDSMREGFKKGGVSRRGFLGLLAGAAAAPEIMKSIKGTKAAKVASKIKLEKAEGMYPWFPDLIEKIKTKGKPFEEKEIIMEASYKHEAKGYGGLPKGVETVTRHVDGDTEFLLREYPDGRIAVDIHSPRNQEGSSTPVTLYYRPTMELKYYSGSKVEPAEFKVLEKEPRYFANGPDDVDIEMSEMRKVPGKNTIYGDVEAAERFATGKIENRKIIPVKQARREQMEDAPTDFIEETSPYGPDTF
jgi:hypothetical protein